MLQVESFKVGKATMKVCFFLFLMNLGMAYSQKCDIFLNKEVGDLILRLDTIHGNVFFDTTESQIVSKVVKIDTTELISRLSKNNLNFIKCNYDSVCQYLYGYNIYSEQFNRNIDSVIRTIYRDKAFFRISDSISLELYEENKNIRKTDSLNCLLDLVTISTHSSLFRNKEYAKLNKKFLLHSIIEFDRYYLLYYYLYVERGPELERPNIEIIFKNKSPKTKE